MLPALLYIIPTIIFLRDETFTKTWLLYLGNACFLFYVFLFEILLFNKQKVTESPVNAGLAVTLTGIIISCILIILCAALFAPTLFQFTSSSAGLKSRPAALGSKGQIETWFILFGTATIGNFVAGSFSSILSGAVLKQKNMPGKNISS